MGVFSGLKKSLARTGDALGDALSGAKKLDAETLARLEDALISSDMGLAASEAIIAALRDARHEKAKSEAEIRARLAAEIEKLLAPVAAPLTIDMKARPFIILMAGVNGTGKTTSIGKLAHYFVAQGKSVMLAAGDTFRAAAIEQLSVWGERIGVPVITAKAGGDAAGLAFDALTQAENNETDILIIDTAGRLQTNNDLMAELGKIIRVLRKKQPQAPHASLLVLDATTGQNALAQVRAFSAIAETSGLIMAKLDGTARGGVLVALARTVKLPVHFIGTGERAEDLHPLDAGAFARALVGGEEA